ncbi:MAG: V-type ATP synthase subunit E family protein [Candidatus Promineifilaceae bacterium]|nr:V-type ATP synthase subunit E family protein [Candidatus Promineifilaceae bacterium]
MTRIIGDLASLEEEVHRIARSKARDKEKKAERRAEEIVEEAKREAEEVQEEILGQARSRAEELRRLRRAQATQDARRKRLTAREEHLEEVWNQAEKALRDLVESEDYLRILRQLAWLAVQTLGPHRLILSADPRGHELLTEERLRAWSEEAGEAFGGPVQFEKAPEPADTWGGMVAEREGGRERIDATFPVRLEEARAEVRDEIFKTLVEER